MTRESNLDAMKPDSAPPDTNVVQTLRRLRSDAAVGLSEPDAAARLADQGPNEISEARPRPFRLFARKFWGLSAWMIELIVILSLVLRKRAELWLALALLVVNAVLSFLQEQRASSAVAALRRELQVSSRVLRGGTWRSMAAQDLVAGDIVRVRGGDFVPSDLQVVEGEVRVDQSALTGESREVVKAVDANVYSGSVVRDGEATGVVTATGPRTYFGKTAQLVETARPKLHVEEVITRVVRWLFLIVGTLVALTLAVSIAERVRLVEVLPISLVVLMSAVPVALPVMFTVSMALGSMELTRRGVIVTHLGAAEDAATMDVLCADKTGTLTMNRLSLSRAIPRPGFDAADVVRDGALAAKAADADPIDLAFLRAAEEGGLLDAGVNQLSFLPFSAATRRTEATVRVGAKEARVVKGALRTLAALTGLGDAEIGALERAATAEIAKGARVIAVARAEAEGPLRLVGLALLRDAPRPDSRRLIDELRALGIKMKMLTGDALPVAKEIAAELGVGEILRAPDLRRQLEGDGAVRAVERGDGFAEVFPEDKFLVVKGLQAAGHVVGMTGDGVNDAPALRQAEVGIAVSGATDVAKEAASVVLTAEGLASIVDLVKGGRRIYQRVLTWIVNKVSQTILAAGVAVVPFLATGRFVISALGMILLVFMTDFVKIALATDGVHPSRTPETWNIGPLVRVGVVLGVLMLIEALAILAIGWRRFGLSAPDGRLETFTFQTLLFFALFAILSIRERGPFWASAPRWPMAAGLAVDAVIGFVIGLHGVAELRALPWRESVFLFGYSAFCSLVLNDLVKLGLLRRMTRSRGTSRAEAPRLASGPRSG